MKVTFLGTGTSHGIPAVGCSCAVCCSPDPRDTRTRCSIVVEWQGKSLLVDTPPELRQQVIRSHIRRVDAILFTHAHADHIFGLDDVRRYNEMQGAGTPWVLAVYGQPETLAYLEQAFAYVFRPTQEGGGKPRLRLVPVEGTRFQAAGLQVEAIPVMHGALEISAFRFGRFAYVTDVSHIPSESLERLRGLDTLVLGALRHEPHPTHFTVAQSLEVVHELAPRRAYFVHMAHTLSHRETNLCLPAHVRLAYDGLIVEVMSDE